VRWVLRRCCGTSVPPGHGKVNTHLFQLHLQHKLMPRFIFFQGPWDGFGGMLKQWARRRKLSRTAWDPNSKMRCPVATRETETMTTPEDCYQAWKSHFETDAWRAKSVGSMCDVSAFYFHWAGEGDITRPASRRRAVRSPRWHLIMLPVLHAQRG
jgi:hypothetical protein